MYRQGSHVEFRYSGRRQDRWPFNAIKVIHQRWSRSCRHLVKPSPPVQTRVPGLSSVNSWIWDLDLHGKTRPRRSHISDEFCAAFDGVLTLSWAIGRERWTRPSTSIACLAFYRLLPLFSTSLSTSEWYSFKAQSFSISYVTIPLLKVSCYLVPNLLEVVMFPFIRRIEPSEAHYDSSARVVRTNRLICFIDVF